MDEGYLLSLKHSLWQLLAGTKGGVTRIRIIELLRDRPYNMNHLHKELSMDYKTIQHHMKTLTNGGIVTTEDKSKYGSVYFISPVLESNITILDEILDKIGKREIKKGRKK